MVRLPHLQAPGATESFLQEGGFFDWWAATSGGGVGQSLVIHAFLVCNIL